MNTLPKPLVSVEWLAKNIEQPNLVILDATLKKVTDSNIDTSVKQQIKGARFFDIKHTFSDTSSEFPNTFPSSKKFEKESQQLGINTDSTIVVYDEYGIYSAPRAWWLFKSFGHENVAVLDGGLLEWNKQGLLIEEPKKI